MSNGLRPLAIISPRARLTGARTAGNERRVRQNAAIMAWAVRVFKAVNVELAIVADNIPAEVGLPPVAAGGQWGRSIGPRLIPEKVWHSAGHRCCRFRAGRGETKFSSALRRALPATRTAPCSLLLLSPTSHVFLPSFMFRPARSHGRALHAVLHPRTRVSLASAINVRPWDGPFGQRRHWSPQGAFGKNELYEAKYAAATKLKETGAFFPRKTKGRKTTGPATDASRINIVNKKLASTMPPHTSQNPRP